MSTPVAFADSPTAQSQPSPYTYYPPGTFPDASQQPSQATTAVAGSSTTASTAVASQPQSRQAAEEARKDRTLAEFLVMLDDYEPLIPNEVTDYYLQRVGFECEDVRLKRLLSLAAQKFVSDIAADAYQHARIRTNAVGGRARGPLTGPGSKDKTRTALTMDDLSAALAEYGINARKPEFYL
ncbi:transcription initiation factor TFIID 23-30kDa subunit-domain-containing protein [Suillus paluster]|uniref:transcription initiation factor TFIID 23-30kDa subunit-domain-containing protein n=1 Tax=Suillus paluster TaxID=48578 RepID=UPI001B87EB82|nr:transcription initiation factor TFIID 23-30kDa subunit-domain-containing protein [Suillus paluster]KAG1746654.1 transcription initiation factor TFIID 23-30kDa subunit-domain-containing protein [Suillus paluster]